MSRLARGIMAFALLAIAAAGAAHAKAVVELDLDICEPGPGKAFTTDIDNRYFPLQPGQFSTLLGAEQGEPFGVRIEVLGEKPFYSGTVATRIVKETEWVDADGDGDYTDEGSDEPLIEESFNYFAQTGGTVCYFGEDVTIYLEDGGTSSEGSWRADGAFGLPGESPGIFMPAEPAKGQFFQTENAPEVAMDEATITAVDRFVKTPELTTREAIKVRDCNPLEKAGSCGTKYYAPAVGLIVDGPVRLTGFED